MNGFTLRYGSRMHVLKAFTRKEEVVKVMAEVRVAVQSTLDRMDAEWYGGDLRRCLAAFDAREWIALASREGDARTAAAKKLKRSWTTLAKACGVDASSTHVRDAATIGIKAFRKLQEETTHVVDNRAAWVRAILDARGTEKAAAFLLHQPVFDLLFSLQIGTGTVERGLGHHMKFRKAHEGAAEGDVSWAEVCYEVWEDGPKHEPDVAVPAQSRDTLLLTDTSRRYAQLWLSKHGRRFCAYKPRRDKGKRNTKLRFVGSMAAVKAGQRKAYERLLLLRGEDVARESAPTRMTLWGEKRQVLVDKAVAKASALEPSKSLQNFQTQTAQILNKKRRERPYSGVHGALPPKRKRTGTTEGCTSSVPRPRPGETPAASSSLPHREAVLVQDGTSQYKKVRLREVSAASVLRVHALDDLDNANGHALTTEWAVAWSFIIGSGASVREAGSDNVVQYKPATGAKLFFTSRFDRKHRHLQESVPRCNPRWEVTDAEAADSTTIDTLADYKTFLLSKRTFRGAGWRRFFRSWPYRRAQNALWVGPQRRADGGSLAQGRGRYLVSDLFHSRQRLLNRSATVATELAASQL